MTGDDAASTTRKLQALLPHLLEHNDQHTEDVRKWAGKARQAGLDAVADELDRIVGLSARVSESFRAAIAKVGD